MKIIVTGTRGIPNILGGVETHCEELFPRIVAMGHDVTIIRRTSYVTENNVADSFKGVKLIDIPCPRKKSFEAIIHTFKAIIKAKRLNANIVHIHAIGPAILTPFARALGLKVVFTHHGPDYDRDKWGALAKMMLKFGEWAGSHFANEVIVISNVIADLIAKKHNRTDSNLIFNGVPTPIMVEDTKYLDQIDVSSGNFIFAMGRFVPEKNFHHLIKAFASIKNNGCKLVLAGDADFEDDYSKYLKQLAKDNGVVLTGFIKGMKLQSLLTHAKGFVLPSSHEGLPISLLEAMSYRLPVVVSDISANMAVNLDAEKYFKLGNIDQLSRKLEKIISEPLCRVDYDMSAYNWDNIASQTIRVYEKLINN